MTVTNVLTQNIHSFRQYVHDLVFFSDLQESNAILRDVIECSEDGIYLKDLESRYILINSAGARIVGRTPEEFLGKTDADLLPPDLARTLREQDLQVIRTGQSKTFENTIDKEDSSRVYHSLKTPRFDARGAIIGLVGISRDITEMKQTALRHRILAQTGEILASSFEYSTQLADISRLAVPHLADWCTVSIIDEDETVQQVAVAHANPARLEMVHELQHCCLFPWDGPIGAAKVMRTGRSEFYSHVSVSMMASLAGDAGYLELIHALQMRSVMIVPLVARGQTLGVMTFVWGESGRHYTEADLALAEELGHRAGLAIDNARLYEAENKARAEAEAAQQRLVLLAETKERNRLAQELHDNVAQSLGYLNLKLAMMSNMLSTGELDQVQANLQELRQMVGETYTDVREEIFNLQDKGFSGLTFLELLSKYIDKYKRFYRLDIRLVMEVEETVFEFPQETRIQLIRIIQEALINIRKHARVNEAVIRLSRKKEQVCISIEDQGLGFEKDRVLREKERSFGLTIMQERVKSAGGHLEIISIPEAGSKVMIWVPLCRPEKSQ